MTEIASVVFFVWSCLMHPGLLMQAQPPPATQATPWEAWAGRTDKRLKDLEASKEVFASEAKTTILSLRKEIVLLRKELTELKDAAEPPAPRSSTPQELSGAVPAKTADGQDIAPAVTVDEILNAVTTGKPIDWKNLGVVLGGFLGTIIAGFIRHWLMQAKIEAKVNEVAAMPAKDVSGGNIPLVPVSIPT